DLARRRSHVQRQRLSVDVAEEPAEACHRATPIDQSAVPARPSDRRLEPADLLLRDLDRIEPLARELEREAAELAERVSHPLEEVRMVLDEKPGADISAGLFVAEDREQHVALRPELFRLRAQERRDEHGDAALHVERAASPDITVHELPAEGRTLPPLACGRDDVDVSV